MLEHHGFAVWQGFDADLWIDLIGEKRPEIAAAEGRVSRVGAGNTGVKEWNLLSKAIMFYSVPRDQEVGRSVCPSVCLPTSDIHRAHQPNPQHLITPLTPQTTPHPKQAWHNRSKNPTPPYPAERHVVLHDRRKEVVRRALHQARIHQPPSPFSHTQDTHAGARAAAAEALTDRNTRHKTKVSSTDGGKGHWCA